MIFKRSEAILCLISIIFAWPMPEIIHGTPIHSSAISDYEDTQVVYDDYDYSSSLEDIKGADDVWDVDVSALLQEQNSFNKRFKRQAHEIDLETADNIPIDEPISAFDLTTPPSKRPKYVRPIHKEPTVQDMIDKIVIFKNNNKTTENPHIYHEHNRTINSDELILYPETPAVEVRKELVPDNSITIAELVYEGSTDRKRKKRSGNLDDLDVWEMIATKRKSKFDVENPN